MAKKKPKPDSGTTIGRLPMSVVYPGKPSNYLYRLGRPTDLTGR